MGFPTRPDKPPRSSKSWRDVGRKPMIPGGRAPYPFMHDSARVSWHVSQLRRAVDRL